jgi:hypothetical protein
MENIDPDKARAVLEQLEAKKAKRLQAKVEAGEVLVISDAVIIGDEAEGPEAIERAKERARAQHGDRNLHFDFTVVITGVPGPGDNPSDDACVSVSESVSSPPLDRERPPTEPPAEDRFDDEEAASPVYVYITIRHGADDGDPGEIAEGMYSVEGGAVVLTDRDGQHITTRALLGEDPATLARQLLREIRKPADFNRRLRYPPLSVA